MSRLGALTAMLLVLSALFAGCTGGGGTETAVPAQEQKTEPALPEPETPQPPEAVQVADPDYESLETGLSDLDALLAELDSSEDFDLSALEAF